MNAKSVLALTALCVVVGLAGWFNTAPVRAQSFGAEAFGPIAPSIDKCAKPMKHFAVMCPVGSSGSFEMYVSYDGGPYVAKF